VLAKHGNGAQSQKRRRGGLALMKLPTAPDGSPEPRPCAFGRRAGCRVHRHIGTEAYRRGKCVVSFSTLRPPGSLRRSPFHGSCRMSMNRVIWAFELTGVSPVAKLAAIELANHGDPPIALSALVDFCVAPDDRAVRGAGAGRRPRLGSPRTAVAETQHVGQQARSKPADAFDGWEACRKRATDLRTRS
jgi:hypothetical protein